jgi:hypothetical protein
MNSKPIKYLAYGLGALALLAGSFFLFAALSGTPMSELKTVGGAFPEDSQEPATASQAMPHPQDEIEQDRRPPEQVLGDATSPLRAFMLPIGFSAGELGELESALERRMAELDLRSRELDERDDQLKQDRQLYDELFTELEGLRSGLLEQEAEQEARAEELDAGQAALKAERRSRFATLAPMYAEGRNKGLMLAKYTPDEAALILSSLTPQRAAELITEIHKKDEDTAKAFQDAYMAAADGAPAAK